MHQTFGEPWTSSIFSSEQLWSRCGDMHEQLDFNLYKMPLKHSFSSSALVRILSSKSLMKNNMLIWWCTGGNKQLAYIILIVRTQWFVMTLSVCHEWPEGKQTKYILSFIVIRLWRNISKLHSQQVTQLNVKIRTD